MRRLREKLAQANLKLGRNYPEPKLSYTQRGTSAGTAWLESYEIRLNPVLLLENSEAFIEEVYRTNWHICCMETFRRVAPHGKEWKWMMESVLAFPPVVRISSNCNPCVATPSPTAASARSISLPYAAIIA